MLLWDELTNSKNCSLTVIPKLIEKIFIVMSRQTQGGRNRQNGE